MTESRVPDVIIRQDIRTVQIGSQEVYIASDHITTSVEDGCMYLTLTLPVRSIAWEKATK